LRCLALSRWLSIGALWLFWLDGEKRKPLILLMWVEGLPPLLTSNKCQRDNASTGVVTLSVEERKGPAALEISSGRDRFAPRPPRRGAEGAMRLG
jgi:hypothetical protein